MNDTLISIAIILIAIFFLFQNRAGRIRFTFRATLYLWLLLLAGFAFLWDSLTK